MTNPEFPPTNKDEQSADVPFEQAFAEWQEEHDRVDALGKSASEADHASVDEKWAAVLAIHGVVDKQERNTDRESLEREFPRVEKASHASTQEDIVAAEPDPVDKNEQGADVPFEQTLTPESHAAWLEAEDALLQQGGIWSSLDEGPEKKAAWVKWEDLQSQRDKFSENEIYGKLFHSYNVLQMKVNEMGDKASESDRAELARRLQSFREYRDGKITGDIAVPIDDEPQPEGEGVERVNLGENREFIDGERGVTGERERIDSTQEGFTDDSEAGAPNHEKIIADEPDPETPLQRETADGVAARINQAWGAKKFETKEGKAAQAEKFVKEINKNFQRSFQGAIKNALKVGAGTTYESESKRLEVILKNISNKRDELKREHSKFKDENDEEQMLPQEIIDRIKISPKQQKFMDELHRAYEAQKDLDTKMAITNEAGGIGNRFNELFSRTSNAKRQAKLGYAKNIARLEQRGLAGKAGAKGIGGAASILKGALAAVGMAAAYACFWTLDWGLNKFSAYGKKLRKGGLTS